MNGVNFTRDENLQKVNEKMTGPVDSDSTERDQQTDKEGEAMGHKSIPSRPEEDIKLLHRNNEKHRKMKINENIDRLLQLIPTNGKNIKMSKNQILDKAYEYMIQLKDKCGRYMEMDGNSVLEERIRELTAENERLRKENECFLEIFRTLNIQPSGLQDMNNQLKSVMKKESEKAATQIANSLISPCQGNMFSSPPVNLLLSPTGSLQDIQLGQSNQPTSLQKSTDTAQPNTFNTTGAFANTGSVPYIDLNSNREVNMDARMNQNLNVGHQMDTTASSISDNGDGGNKKNSDGMNDSRGEDMSDVEEVLKQIIGGTGEGSDPPPYPSTQGHPAFTDGGQSIDHVGNHAPNHVQPPGSTSSGTPTQANIPLGGASTHQPSATTSQGLPTATTAATYPTTMVSQAVTGPLVTSSSPMTSQPQLSTTAPSQVQQGMKLVLPPTGIQQNVIVPQPPQQQTGQTLFLTLPGRPNQLIPVRITPTAQQRPPVILPNQGQSGNVAKQLNAKRRPLKIREQKKEITQPTMPVQPQFVQSGIQNPGAPQTVTLRLPIGTGANPQGNIVLNQQGQMIVQPPVQQTVQPVIINTGNGQQQTVYMQVPVQMQQPAVQQPTIQHPQPLQQNQQVVYIRQNGQLIQVPVMVQNPQSQGQPQGQSQGPQQVHSQEQQVQSQQQAVQQNQVMLQQSVVQQPVTSNIPVMSQGANASVSGPQISTTEPNCSNGVNVSGPNLSKESSVVHRGQPVSSATPSSSDQSLINSNMTLQNIGQQGSVDNANPLVHNETNSTSDIKGGTTKTSCVVAHPTISHPVSTSAAPFDSNDILAKAAEHIFLDPSLGAPGSVQPHQIQNDDNSSAEECSHKSKKKKKKKTKPREKTKCSKVNKKEKKSRKSKKKSEISFSPDIDNLNIPSTDDTADVDPFLHSMLDEKLQAAVNSSEENKRSIVDASSSNLTNIPVNVSSSNSTVNNFLSSFSAESLLSSAMSGNGNQNDGEEPQTVFSQANDNGGADILSNSMNFIGLPTYEEDDSKEKENPKNDMMPDEPKQSTINEDHSMAMSRDDDDEIPQPFSPPSPTSPEVSNQENSSQEKNDNSGTGSLSHSSVSPGHADPTSTLFSESAPSVKESAVHSDFIPVTSASPPDYPFTFNNKQNVSHKVSTDEELKGGSSTLSTFDILSQPWLTRSASSRNQSEQSELEQGQDPGPRLSESNATLTEHSGNKYPLTEPNIKSSTHITRQHSPPSTAINETPDFLYPFYSSSGSASKPVSSSVYSNPFTANTPTKVLESSKQKPSVIESSSKPFKPNFNFYSSLSSANPTSGTPSFLDTFGSFQQVSKDTPHRNDREVSEDPFAPYQIRSAKKTPNELKQSKSFTKANIHRTLTSFQKQELELSKKEEERLNKLKRTKEAEEASKQASSTSSTKAKEEGNSELSNIGHRALDQNLVTKFPWLEESEKDGNKSDKSKVANRNTSFSVQSISQSSAKARGQKKQELKETAPTPVTSSIASEVTSRTSQAHTVSETNTWNLWNPSFPSLSDKSKITLDNFALDESQPVINQQGQTAHENRSLSASIKDLPNLLGPAAVQNPSEEPKGSSSSCYGKPPKKSRKRAAEFKKLMTPSVETVSIDLTQDKSCDAQSMSHYESPAETVTPASQLPSYHLTQQAENLSQVTSDILNSSTPMSHFNLGMNFAQGMSQGGNKDYASANTISKSSTSLGTGLQNVSSATDRATDHQTITNDLFHGQMNLDFLFDKPDQSDLSDNLVDSLSSDTNGAMNTMNKRGQDLPQRSNVYPQTSNMPPAYGARSPYNQQVGRQTPHTITPQSQPSSPFNQPIGRQTPQAVAQQSQPRRSPSINMSSSSAKRHATDMQQPNIPTKKQHKQAEQAYRSPMSDSSGGQMMSPASDHYGSPQVPADDQGLHHQPPHHQQSSTRGNNYRFSQSGQNYSRQQPNSGPSVAGFTVPGSEASMFPKTRNTHSFMSASEQPTRSSSKSHIHSRGISEPWSSQIPNQTHPRSSQNTAYIPDLSPSNITAPTFSQNDTTSSTNVLSSLSPSRHLRREELPTYFPSPLHVGAPPLLSSPPYPGKTPTSREPDISTFNPLFPPARSNLAHHVGHNFSVYPEPHPHTSKHSHMSTASPFPFPNMFNDSTPGLPSAHGNPPTNLHSAMHLHGSNPLQGEDSMSSLRPGQRHRNQGLSNSTMRLEHILGPNSAADIRGSFPVGVPPMGMPAHHLGGNPFPGMPHI